MCIIEQPKGQVLTFEEILEFAKRELQDRKVSAYLKRKSKKSKKLDSEISQSENLSLNDIDRGRFLPLDNIMNNSLKEEQKIQDKKTLRTERYRIREVIKQLPGISNYYKIIRVCGSVKNKIEGVGVNRSTDNRLFYGNILKCGCRWGCPICSAKIGAVQAQKIYKALEAYQESKFGLFFVTLTTQHNKTQSCNEVLKKIQTTWGKISKNINRFQWLCGYYVALEFTYSDFNGWHPHLHILVVHQTNTDAALADVEKIVAQWLKNDTTAMMYGQKIKQCNDAKDLSEYISKVALKFELTGTTNKQSKRGDGLTPFGMVETHTSHFLEFLKTVKRQKMNFRSKNFFGLMKIKELTDLEALEQGTTIAETLMKFSTKEYEYLKTIRVLGSVLNDCETMTYDQIKTKYQVPEFVNESEAYIRDIKPTNLNYNKNF